MDVREIKAGETLWLEDGPLVQGIAARIDGERVRVKYLESMFEAALGGTDGKWRAAGRPAQPGGAAGGQEGGRGRAGVEARATAPQGRQGPVRGVTGHRADRQRTLDHAHGPPEGLAVVVAGSEVGGTQGGHDLGIGGDLGRHAEGLRDHQVDVVVHVPVLDRRDHA